MALPVTRQVLDAGRTLITLPAPRGSRTVWESGDIVAKNGVACVLVSLTNAVANDVVVGQYEGEFEIDCESATTASEGADAFYNEATRKVVTAGGDGIIYLGTFNKAKTSGQLVATVLLRGTKPFRANVVQHVRQRFTAAQINAGATLVPAVPGYRIRMVDCKMIAIGGNATTATSVDLKATQSASVVNLVAGAVAGLTANAVGRDGATNFAVIAGGASYNHNDAGTALTVGKTGSNLAGATDVDFIVSFVIEK